MRVEAGKWTRFVVGVVGVTLAAALTATGCSFLAGKDGVTDQRANTAARAAAAASGLNCNETEDKYHNKGYVYFYSREKCKGSHGAKDNSDEDRDHGDDEGQIKKWDNNADSIVNTTTSHVEFYNYPKYNTTPTGKKKGDRFCLGPGEWINRLQYYGDADGSNDW